MTVPVFVKDTGERAVKSFFQFYIAAFLFVAGLGDTTMAEPGNVDNFDLLFTADNVKAGAVGAFLSIATSIISKPFGNKENASLVE